MPSDEADWVAGIFPLENDNKKNNNGEHCADVSTSDQIGEATAGGTASSGGGNISPKVEAIAGAAIVKNCKQRPCASCERGMFCGET